MQASAFFVTLDPGKDRFPALVSIVVSMAGLAWIATVMLHEQLHGPHYPEYLDGLPQELRSAIRYCGEVAIGQGPGALGWIAGWGLMTVAMMLPPALPLLTAFRKLTQGRRDSRQLIALTMALFLAVWLVAGILLFSAGAMLNWLLQRVPLLAGQSALLAGAAALLAGAYQFTPLKKACLDACRSPMSVIMTRWHPLRPSRSAMAIGVAYGAICVGCCWALMILSVVAGAMALPIMAVAAIIMMLERVAPAVRPLIPVQAGFAVAIGLLLIAGTLPAAFQIG